MILKGDSMPFSHLSFTFESHFSWPNGRCSSCAGKITREVHEVHSYALINKILLLDNNTRTKYLPLNNNTKVLVKKKATCYFWWFLRIMIFIKDEIPSHNTHHRLFMYNLKLNRLDVNFKLSIIFKFHVEESIVYIIITNKNKLCLFPLGGCWC